MKKSNEFSPEVRKRAVRMVQEHRGEYDNALAETINGLYKAELIHLRALWKTREAVELAKFEWVSWFNHHRLIEPIAYIQRPRPRQTTGANNRVDRTMST